MTTRPAETSSLEEYTPVARTPRWWEPLLEEHLHASRVQMAQGFRPYGMTLLADLVQYALLEPADDLPAPFTQEPHLYGFSLGSLRVLSEELGRSYDALSRYLSLMQMAGLVLLVRKQRCLYVLVPTGPTQVPATLLTDLEGYMRTHSGTKAQHLAQQVYIHLLALGADMSKSLTPLPGQRRPEHRWETSTEALLARGIGQAIASLSGKADIPAALTHLVPLHTRLLSEAIPSQEETVPPSAEDETAPASPEGEAGAARNHTHPPERGEPDAPPVQESPRSGDTSERHTSTSPDPGARSAFAVGRSPRTGARRKGVNAHTKRQAQDATQASPNLVPSLRSPRSGDERTICLLPVPGGTVTKGQEQERAGASSTLGDGKPPIWSLSPQVGDGNMGCARPLSEETTVMKRQEGEGDDESPEVGGASFAHVNVRNVINKYILKNVTNVHKREGDDPSPEVGDNPQNVRSVSFHHFFRNEASVHAVAQGLCTLFGEPGSKQGIYLKLLREGEYPPETLRAALLYALVHVQDGTIRNPAAFFIARLKTFHATGIPSEAAELVQGYGELSYEQLLACLRPCAASRNQTLGARAVTRSGSLPPRLRSQPALAVQIPLEAGGGMTREAAWQLCTRIRPQIGIYQAHPVALADQTYALLLDGSVKTARATKVRQKALYSAQQWQQEREHLLTHFFAAPLPCTPERSLHPCPPH